MSQIIPIGCDHAGYDLKQEIIKIFSEKGYEFEDFGCHSTDSIDYPDYAHPVSEKVSKNDGMLGILICGSGNGISMTANKHQKIRCALCWENEIAALARQHNNANIISLPARFISVEDALEMVETFLTTEFEGGRHERRVSKISC